MLKAFVKRFVFSRLPVSLVLMYHRISYVERDYYGICVDPKNFEEHAMIIKKFACKIDDIFSIKPQLRIFITFDDGYKDNFDFAKKILEKYDLSAAFFITTGFLGKRKIWIDELAELFQHKVRTNEIYIEYDNKKKLIKVIITEDNDFSKLDFDLYYKFRKVIFGQIPFAKEEIFRLKKSEFFALAYVLIKYSREPYRYLENLKRFFMVEHNKVKDEKNSNQDTSLFMTEDDVFELSLNENFLIGAHTETHRVLSVLDRREQEYEILQSKNVLQKITGREIFCFAYPFGLEGDFSEITQEICKKYFKYSFTGIKRVCSIFTPRHKIPRFYVPNCDGEVFERKIFEFLYYLFS